MHERTLYEVLGVARGADEATIRAAYNALMKQHHPDRVGRAGAQDGARAAELNAAFAVLRNPGRRTQYDAELRYRDMRTAPPSSRSPPPAPPAAGPGRAAVYAGWGIGGLGAAVIAALIVSEGIADRPAPAATPERARTVAQSEVAPDPPPPAPPQSAPVSGFQVGQAISEFARVSTQSGPQGAAQYSDLCFDEHKRTRRADDLDFCIAFDRAAARRYRGLAATGDDGPSRFQPALLIARHREAGLLVNSDPAWVGMRIAQIAAMVEESGPRVALAEPPAVVMVDPPAPAPPAIAALSLEPAPLPPPRRASPVRRAQPKARTVAAAPRTVWRAPPPARRAEPRPRPRTEAPREEPAPRNIRVGPQ